MANKKQKPLGAILHKSGVTFRVWAPFAESVAVSGSFNDWARVPMEHEEDGVWTAEIKDAVAGQEYKFVIKNGDKELVHNDPRALQMTTSDGNSVIVDTNFDWEDDNFTPPKINEQVMYELHVGTFNRPDPSISGTFTDVIAKLDYLAELGINMIELMPINTMAMDRGWGYANDYIFAVESLYGGRRGLLEFVKAAHKRGIGIILDVVFNHIGPDDGLDLWQFDGWSENDKGGIYFYNDWRSQTPWGETRPDYGRPEVRQYFLDNVKLWLQDCHLDGLRFDSTIYLRNVLGNNDDPDNDLAEGWQLMQDMTSLSRKINPYAITIAEDIAYNSYITKPTSEGGAGFHAQWEVTFPRTLRSTLEAVNDADRNTSDVCAALTKRYNHDVFQRVIYSDSHDSAANGSSRLSEEISPDNPTDVFARKRSLIATALVLTVPGIPMLFQGQEFMQPGNFNDWQALDWSRTEKFSGIVEASKHLIALRKNAYGNTLGLTGQSVNVLQCDDENKLMAYHRWEFGGASDDVVVVINFANKTHKEYWLNFPKPGIWHVRFSSDWKGYSPDFKGVETQDVTVESDRGKLAIAPYSVLILSQD